MRSLSRITLLLAGWGWLLLPVLQACIWDSDTLWSERRKQPELAALILGKSTPRTDKAFYRKKLSALRLSSRPEDPIWLNEVAGAYLRLGEPQEAVALLAPRAIQFTNDYGVQANLGTAYHLLGRYSEAERHIARDLVLNPDAHFGLEKYHLALLQYLVRDQAWKEERVYIDEFSPAFRSSKGSFLSYDPGLARLELALPEYAVNAPAYRSRWNLDEDRQLADGLSYIASLNPQEPAVFEMLGVLCWKNRDLNLAAAAFEKAIALGSPKAVMLQMKVDSIREHIEKAQGYSHEFDRILALLVALIPAAILAYWRSQRAARAVRSPSLDQGTG